MFKSIVYKRLYNKIDDILRGYTTEYDIDKIENSVDEAYECGHLKRVQYESLMERVLFIRTWTVKEERHD